MILLCIMGNFRRKFSDPRPTSHHDYPTNILSHTLSKSRIHRTCNLCGNVFFLFFFFCEKLENRKNKNHQQNKQHLSSLYNNIRIIIYVYDRRRFVFIYYTTHIIIMPLSLPSINSPQTSPSRISITDLTSIVQARSI